MISCELQDGERIIRQMAEAAGITAEQVRSDMMIAIEEGFHNPEKRDEWIKRFGENVKPTPEEFIVALTNEITGKMQFD